MSPELCTGLRPGFGAALLPAGQARTEAVSLFLTWKRILNIGTSPDGRCELSGTDLSCLR